MANPLNISTDLKSMADLPGVKDLPSTVKLKFIKALKAEFADDHETAAKELDGAIAAEDLIKGR